jgi:hypothetical protein
MFKDGCKSTNIVSCDWWGCTQLMIFAPPYQDFPGPIKFTYGETGNIEPCLGVSKWENGESQGGDG